MKTIEQIVASLESVVQYGTPMDGAATLMDVGTGPFLDFIENEILDTFIISGGSTCKFFEGGYGTGKTHLLHLIRDLGLNKNMAVVEIELSEALQLEDWDSIVRTITRKMQWINSGTIVESFPNVLTALALNGYKPEKPLKATPLPHAGYANAIELYITESIKSRSPKADLLRRFILGEKITVKQLKSVGIQGVRNSLTLRNAESVFNTILSSLHYIGLPGVIILFDETDQNARSWTSSSKKASASANVMRRLIDACTLSDVRGLFVVFALLPNFIQACTKNYQALYDRLNITYKSDSKVGWRSPVLGLNSITSTPNPDEFMLNAVKKFAGIAHEVGLETDFSTVMIEAGRRVLQEHAGLDFRRPLIRMLSNIILTQTKFRN